MQTNLSRCLALSQTQSAVHLNVMTTTEALDAVIAKKEDGSKRSIKKMTINELMGILSAYPDYAEVKVDTINDTLNLTGTVTYDFGTSRLDNKPCLILEASK